MYWTLAAIVVIAVWKVGNKYVTFRKKLEPAYQLRKLAKG